MPAALKMKVKPYEHQLKRWIAYGRKKNWAHFWEQGTGKSKITIDTAAQMYLDGEINALIVCAPGGVHKNWESDELPTHMSDDVPYRAFSWQAYQADTKAHAAAFQSLLSYREGLAVLCISYDAAAITQKGKQALWDFLRKRRCMFVLDESARIKTPGAKRTKTLLKAGIYAEAKRLLTGTPSSGSPFDMYSQMKFLDPDFWKINLGIGSFTAYKAHFGIQRTMTINGRSFDQTVGYKNLDQLQALLALHSDRVLKEDVLDLPPKVYQMRYYDLTPEQRRVYKSLKEECLAWLASQKPCETCLGTGHVEYEGDQFSCFACEGTGKESAGTVTATMAITRMIRFQQICSGYLVTDDGEIRDIPGGNPRLELMRDIASDQPPGEPHIIWARFRRDIELICDAMKRDNRSFVRYDGSVDDADRLIARNRVQDGSVDFFIANQQSASEGITLTRSNRVTYYNNTYKLTERLQSEDRPHRIGQTKSVLYDDLVCEGTTDFHAVKALRAKMDVASAITGDKLKEWLI